MTSRRLLPFAWRTALAAACLAWANAAVAQSALSTKDCPYKEAIVLVGGMHEDWRYFQPWLPQLKNEPACIYGFTRDHRAQPMSESAALLAQDLLVLRDQGLDEVTVLAHSMGGLVAKKALLTVAHEAPQFGATLHAYGTPWGGFFWANFINITPGLDSVLSQFGVPMGAEIGSWSQFMTELSTPLPPSMRLVVHHSTADRLAAPQTRLARKNLNTTFAQARVRLYNNLGHDEFASRLRFER